MGSLSQLVSRPVPADAAIVGRTSRWQAWPLAGCNDVVFNATVDEVPALPGAAHLVLPPGVAHLDPESAVFEAMLEGWTRQQRVRFLTAATIRARIQLVRRLAEFSNQYPWQWQLAEYEAFMVRLMSGEQAIKYSTARGYEQDLRLFVEYVTDARYGWSAICAERFGEAPQQLLHERNTIVHVSEYEGQPARRPLSYDEVQALFDAADGRVEQIRSRGRKGALAALRDATLLKVIYAYGLRRREAWGLDLQDLRRNPSAPQFGRVGALFIRYGKSSRGAPPKRRTVLTVPEMDWVVPLVEYWLDEVRPRFAPGNHPALWITERRGRVPSGRSTKPSRPRERGPGFLTRSICTACGTVTSPTWKGAELHPMQHSAPGVRTAP